MLRLVCMHTDSFVSIPIHALQELKSTTTKNQTQNVTAVPRPEFPVLSNGALVFGVCLILCIGKWRKHFTETVVKFNRHFQHKDSTYRKPKCTNRKSVKFWFRNNIKILDLLSICIRFLPLKSMGIHMPAART